MQLAFVDEMGDAKLQAYLGICVAMMNARFYPSLKRKTQEILTDVGWSPKVEFKGSHLFSASTGCTDVEIQKRIDAARQLLDLNVAGANSRMQFHYGRMQSGNHGQSYLDHLPTLLDKCLPKAPSGAGKNLLVVVCDERSDVAATKLHAALEPVTRGKNWVLLEHVIKAKSGFDTIGLMYADLVGYLVARIDTIANDSELFQGLTGEQLQHDGKFKKLRSSTELMKKIKKLKLYDHESWGS